jgi:hypothetical protein
MAAITILSGSSFKKTENAGLGGIKTSVPKKTSPMGEILLEVSAACGTIDLSGNGVWHILRAE